jgi:hypothetical protein
MKSAQVLESIAARPTIYNTAAFCAALREAGARESRAFAR